MKKQERSWVPIVAMWGIVALATAAMVQIEGAATPLRQMQVFAAMFLLTFSIPKFMHLRGFAERFARYDLVAGRFLPYAYLYPFLELALGFGYLADAAPLLLNGIVLFVMALSGMGVFMALHEGRKLRSANMGSIFTVPLGLITLMENAVIAGIAMTILWRM